MALDTNVLLYAEGLHGATLQQQATRVVDAIPPASMVIPAQVMGETFHALVRKGGRTRNAARQVVHLWQDGATVVATSEDIVTSALDLAVHHQLAVWDAIILAAASEAGCRMLLSEDMQEGFAWGGVTIINPFAATPHRLLTALLGRAD